MKAKNETSFCLLIIICSLKLDQEKLSSKVVRLSEEIQSLSGIVQKSLKAFEMILRSLIHNQVNFLHL